MEENKNIQISAYAIPGIDRNITNMDRVIINLVCEYFRLCRDDLKSKKRHQEIVTGRHIAMYLIRKHTNKRFKNIGKIFNRDHTTAICAMNKINGFIDIQDKATVTAIETIGNFLKN